LKERAEQARRLKAANTNFCYHCRTKIGIGMKAGLGHRISFRKNVNTETIMITVCNGCFDNKTKTTRGLLNHGDRQLLSPPAPPAPSHDDG
jgi:hypothetical protein